ncbi:unnamed protein product [Effrenium voratum]|uniref:Uncharacterized protein n=1 Tax=Effrenium voratum TaxID=2562239 RepID=A0AA36N3I6_9DINO|nr:unnamed protein product [Effrenium voratum]
MRRTQTGPPTFALSWTCQRILSNRSGRSRVCGGGVFKVLPFCSMITAAFAIKIGRVCSRSTTAQRNTAPVRWASTAWDPGVSSTLVTSSRLFRAASMPFWIQTSGSPKTVSMEKSWTFSRTLSTVSVLWTPSQTSALPSMASATPCKKP